VEDLLQFYYVIPHDTLSNDVALLIEIIVNGQFSRGEGNVIVIFFHYAGVSIDCKIVHSSPKENALISLLD
jgi:hypothetical protein